MILDKRTKKILKVLCLILVVGVLTGCATNLKDGQLIPARAITESSPWNLGQGWFDFLFIIPIAKGIIFATKFLGNNAAMGVIGITILINLITLPIMIKSTVSMQKMQLLQPEVEKIQRKYKGRKDQASKLRMNDEMQRLYKKNNVSMFGSFTTFLTLPIMLAMWQAVQRIQILYGTIFLGIDLGVTPWARIQKFDIPYFILLILVAGTQFFAMEITNMMSKRNPKYKISKQAETMQKMNRFFTIMIIFFAATMPAAMSIYWITTNLVNIIRTIYIQIYHIEKAKKEVETVNTNFLNKK